VTDIGNELLSGPLQLFQPSQIVKDQNGAVTLARRVKNRRTVDLQEKLIGPRQL
jgi:hypothetical protein